MNHLARPPIALAAIIAASVLPGAAHAAAPNCYATADGATACTIDPTIDPLALCNDGTVPAFWYRPGAGSGKNRWVFWFEGGSQCVDQPTCTARAEASSTAGLITSTGFQPGAGQGLLSNSSTINPVLYNANIVLLHYCSSDTWAGARPASGAPFSQTDVSTWSFEGRRIAIAQVKSVAELAPSLASATKIMVGGSSAGGVGATINVNAVTPLLPKSVPVLFVNDAGFALDVGQYESTIPSPYSYQGHPNDFETALPQRLSFWHGKGDARCDGSATTSQEHADCYNTAYLLDNGYIALPSFVAESQLDTAQITDEICPEGAPPSCKLSHDKTTMEGVYETYFATRMSAALKASGTEAAFTAYGPDTLEHVILSDTIVFTTGVPFPSGSLSPRNAFDAWLSNTSAPRKVQLGTGPGVQ